MSKQNIYDNEVFFEEFQKIRDNKINFNDCMETPILLSMLPDPQGKEIWISAAEWDSTQNSTPIWEPRPFWGLIFPKNAGICKRT